MNLTIPGRRTAKVNFEGGVLYHMTRRRTHTKDNAESPIYLTSMSLEGKWNRGNASLTQGEHADSIGAAFEPSSLQVRWRYPLRWCCVFCFASWRPTVQSFH